MINEAISKLRKNTKLHFVGEDSDCYEPPDDFLEDNWIEANMDLNRYLQSLSETARTVLLMHEVEGFSHKEIASFFGKSESFSKTTLYRAYLSLKETVLEKNGALQYASQ